MRYLISGRHGHYDDCTGDLTSKGLEQIEDLASAIKDITDPNSLCMTYAGERRVVQTAETLAKKLGISDSRRIDSDTYLIKGTYSIRGDLAFEAYKSWAKEYSALIFVSHELPTIDNTYKFAEKMHFDKKVLERFIRMGLNEGRAILLDLEQKTFKTIPSEKIIHRTKITPSDNTPLAF